MAWDDPTAHPHWSRWWPLVRQTVLLVLGVLVVLDSFMAGSDKVAELIAGLILLGLVPVDVMLDRWRKSSGDPPPTHDS